MYKTNENGRSMIEMLGVLAIIGVLSVGGIAAFGKMYSRYKINETQNQINAISSKISAIGAENSSYSGLNNIAAIKFGAVPTQAVDNAAAGTLSNLYGGSITIEGAPLIEKSKELMAYQIKYTGISIDACMMLATSDWGGKKSSVVGLGVGSDSSVSASIEKELYKGCSGKGAGSGNAYAVACPSGGTLDVPMTPVEAAKACGCKGQSCILVIKFM